MLLKMKASDFQALKPAERKRLQLSIMGPCIMNVQMYIENKFTHYPKYTIKSATM
jgi:hypothetical protein